MTTATGSSITRAPRPSSLADVLDLILDKGLVIDAYVRISAVGIEVLTIDARIVIASVDTYLHYAEAVNRLDLTQTETQGITGLFDNDDESGNRSSNGTSSNGRASRPRSNQVSRGSGRAARELSRGDDGYGSDADDEENQEGRGRSLARRLGEKGKWSS
jgi:hypothetical protein